VATTATASGLDDVIAAETALSDVDGEAGRLVIRGHRVEDLVGRATFEDAFGLVWTGHMPSVLERDVLRADLAEARRRAFRMVPFLGGALDTPDAMDAVRAAIAQLPSADDGYRDAMALAGAIPVFAAAWQRTRRRRAALAPDPRLSHAADVLRMVSGAEPPPARVAGLDAYLCCVVDHGLNASTFVARTVASTGSDTVSAVVAAIGALKGPLHGGAPAGVLEMLDSIPDARSARACLEAQLAAGARIMGMGHRVYRVRDPRAAALEAAATALEQAGEGGARMPLARAVEREAERVLAARHPGRRLRANVEFYTAVLLEAIGIPRDLFSPLFASSRVVGWCAHVEEQRRVGRLIRPRSRYVGPPAA
jgi:citrate synthase